MELKCARCERDLSDSFTFYDGETGKAWCRRCYDSNCRLKKQKPLFPKFGTEIIKLLEAKEVLKGEKRGEIRDSKED